MLRSVNIIIPIDEFLFYHLYNGEQYTLQVYQVLLAGLVAVAAYFVVFIAQKIFEQESIFPDWTEMDQERRQTFFRVGRAIIYALGLLLLVQQLGIDITLNDVLEYQIVALGDYAIHIYNILLIFVITFLTFFITFFIRKVLGGEVYKDMNLDQGRKHALFQIIKYIIYTVAIVLGIRSAGLDVSILLAGSAALFVGLGLGLQQTFNDFVSGIIILFDSTIEVGDVVEVAGVVGKVKSITLRTTYIETRDSVTIVVPNSRFTSENVINWSHDDWETRFHVTVGVAYGSDIELVKNLLYNCAYAHPLVLKHPQPSVMFMDFGDNALVFDLLFWSNNPFEKPGIASDIRFAVEKAFRDHDINIPFPQRDLHIVTDVRKKSVSS